MVEPLKTSDWHGHLANKLISVALLGRNQKKDRSIYFSPTNPLIESLELYSTRRLSTMNNVSPVVEKVLGYDFTRSGHIEDVMQLARNTLYYLWKSQPKLFDELIKDYGLTPEEIIIYSTEVGRLHDILTLPLQGVFHRRLKIKDENYHEDKALLAVFNNDENYSELKKIVFDDKTLEYYKKTGIKLEILRKLTEDSINGTSLLGQLLKKGKECPSFDWISYTVRDFTELLRIFKIEENLPFEEKIRLVVQNLLGVTNALSKNVPFQIPENKQVRKEITDLVPVDTINLSKIGGKLKIVADGDVISKIYLMHSLLRLFFSGSPWMQGAENYLYTLFEKRFRNDKEKLWKFLLTKSEEELLDLIRGDINLISARGINITKPKSIPRQLKGWNYTSVPGKERTKKSFIIKDLSGVLIWGENDIIAPFSEIFPSLLGLDETIKLNTPLFLHQRPLNMSKEDPIPRFEHLNKSLRTYAEDLYRAGFKDLIHLLDKDYEVEVLNILRDSFYTVMKKFDLPSQPNQRQSPDIEKQIRLEIQKLMKVQRIDKYFDIRFYTPEELVGIIAPYILKETHERSTHWDISDFGKIVLELQQAFPEMTVLLVAGRAEDITGGKTPKFRRNELLPAASYRFTLIRDLLIKFSSDELNNKVPKSDMDFMILNGPPLETMLNFLQKKFSGREFSFKIKQSSRRTFEYIDFGTRETKGIKGRVKRKSWGQIFFPGFNGSYKQDNLLITSIMSDGPRGNLFLVLFPYTHKKNGEKQTMIWGMTLDSVRGKQDFSRHRLTNQFFLGDPFIIAYYPFASKRFLSGSMSDSLFAFRHDFRDWGYSGKHPLITIDGRPISENQLDDINTLNRLAKETVLFFSRKVIHPIAEMSKKNINAIGNKNQRLKNGISILTDLAIGFDGDLASILRVLPAGVSLTKSNRDFFDSNINVYGLGVFDENGWFPEIGRSLKNPLILNKLKEKIFKYVSELEKPQEEREKYLGRKLFYDFLFEITEGNANKAFELLRPVWCTKEEWKEVFKNKKTRLWEKLLIIDPRFIQINSRL